MFLVIDGCNSQSFDDLPNLFGQPIVCLMSPCNLPPSTQGQLTLYDMMLTKAGFLAFILMKSFFSPGQAGASNKRKRLN